MLLQTNSYIVPKEKRVQHARLMRRFRQTMHRLGCDQFEAYEQVAANWNAAGESGRFVQIMRFRDRRHQQAVQIAEREDAGAQQLIAEFCNLINLPYQHQQGYFATGFYTSVPGVAPAPIEEYYEDEVFDDSAPAPDEVATAETLDPDAAQPGAAVAAAPEDNAVEAEFHEPQPAFGQAHPEGEPRSAEEALDIPNSVIDESSALADPGTSGIDLSAQEAAEQVRALDGAEQPVEAPAAPAVETAGVHEVPPAAPVASADEFDALLDSELKSPGETGEPSPEVEQDFSAMLDAVDDPRTEVAVNSLESTEIVDEAHTAEVMDESIAETPVVQDDDSEIVELERAAPEIHADFAELTIAVPSSGDDVVTMDDVLAARDAQGHEEPSAELEPLSEEAATGEIVASSEAAENPDEPSHAHATTGPEHHDDPPVIPTIGDAHDRAAPDAQRPSHAGESFDEALAEDLRLAGSAAPDSNAGTNGHPAPAEHQTLTDDELFEMFLKELGNEAAPDANTPAR